MRDRRRALQITHYYLGTITVTELLLLVPAESVTFTTIVYVRPVTLVGARSERNLM